MTDERGLILPSSVICRLSSDYAHEMRDFGDHPARGRRVLKLADATDAIESETDKGLALVVAAPDRAADLLDLDGLPGGRIRGRHWASSANFVIRWQQARPRCREVAPVPTTP